MVYRFVLFLSVVNCITSELSHTAGGSDFCIIDGRPYRNGERVPRQHPCHVCLCHFGKAECSWMNCPPPPEGCTEFTVPNYCNPALYICPIPEHIREDRYKRSLHRLTRSADTPATGLKALSKAKGDCSVLGVPYRTGDLMGIATSFCLECRCGRQNLFCSPKCCFGYAGFNENVTAREASERGQTRMKHQHPLHYVLML